jgi:hypothetical protein
VIKQGQSLNDLFFGSTLRSKALTPTTSHLCRNSNSACLPFSPTTSARHRPSTGPRDFVRSCQTPVLILPEEIPAHPYAVAKEAAMLAAKLRSKLVPSEGAQGAGSLDHPRNSILPLLLVFRGGNRLVSLTGDEMSNCPLNGLNTPPNNPYPRSTSRLFFCSNQGLSQSKI